MKSVFDFLYFITPHRRRVFGFTWYHWLVSRSDKMGYVLLSCTGFSSENLRELVHDSIDFLLRDHEARRFLPGRVKPYLLDDTRGGMSPSVSAPQDLFIAFDPQNNKVIDILDWLTEAGLLVTVKEGPVVY